jgi:hypothetical protein
MSKKPEKPETRKAPAAKRAAPKGAMKTNVGICGLLASWRFLEAEGAYLAAMSPDGESDAALRKHQRQQDEIETKLSRLIPQDFDEVRELLEHAVEMREGGFRCDGADQMILRNILESLHNVTEAARNDGMEKMRRTINFVTENASKMIAAELNIRRSA